jgi:phosphoribosyl-ATP pyrophosphohydrolase/phosphoribosyl-AMP cyclohydrolase
MSEFRELLSPKDITYGKILDPQSSEMLVPVIVIDVNALAADGLRAIRMQGWANRAAVAQTLETGLTTFWSRSKQGIWVKGAESGNILPVNNLYTDCDNDCIIADVSPVGPTCHTGTTSCFNTKSIGE